ncbi:MAG: DUF115 domain-containing protein [Methanocorpusculum sp.]|nr:DUF115 domain-containing protein [Methanocorpusculum sp.]
MKPEDWESYYVRILDWFGFSREDDERAAGILSSLLPRNSIELLKKTVEGSDWIVAGNSPSLKDELKKTDFTGYKIMSADAASLVLYKNGIRPDVIVSDLDGMDEEFFEMNDKGTILVLHAHGDNIPLIKSWVPRVRGEIVGTTQSSPLSNVYNFGGFSDGDRAVFLAKELGARSVKLIGFNLDDKSVDPVKHGKLMIARKLLKIAGYDI